MQIIVHNCYTLSEKKLYKKNVFGFRYVLLDGVFPGVFVVICKICICTIYWINKV